MDNQAERNQSIKKLGELIKDIKIAMLTTAEADGTLRSRPMGTQQTEFDGDLWFFTGTGSPKAQEIEKERNVNVSYAEPKSNKYVSVSGVATLVHDQPKAKELWNPLFKTWFPKGLDDPNLALLKVTVTQAEYWDAPSSSFVTLAGFVKVLATGHLPEIGENKKLELHADPSGGAYESADH